jgi:DNA repair protein RadA/Sms
LKKLKTTYICQNCGTQYAKQQGKCGACDAWNTIVEELMPQAPSTASSWEVWPYNQSLPSAGHTPKPLQDIQVHAEDRISCSDQEFNRVLGGGIVPGSLVLIGGEPGIGKSTLLLQIALSLPNQKVLYISGEESEAQIKLRAQRMSVFSEHCYIFYETSLNHILQQATHLQPDILIIDSIQTLYLPQLESVPGSVAQIRMCTANLLHYAKSTHTPTFVIGHITKEGSLAGPKVLEHMVDTVLQFEGDRHLAYRIVKSIKNRFGTTPELGIYEMLSYGLRAVTNPSELLVSQANHALTGIAIGAFLEGNRSLLIEVQALVSPATYSTPQRSTTGFDSKRLNMLLAVLEKRAGLRLGIQDVFLNIAGGLKVADPALDLAICLAIASSFKDQVIPHNYCFAAEVGLGGEVRGVTRIEQRILEAARLGFVKIFISTYNQKELATKQFPIHIQPVTTLQDAMQCLWPKI